ncbi:hypothetical protein BGZ57DRAFT_858180 [Hyaloscypha finlandica]|nr:hypothetical protein BGZ57DRAFT_858180 [Hyaloscypha finlandica]
MAQAPAGYKPVYLTSKVDAKLTIVLKTAAAGNIIQAQTLANTAAQQWYLKDGNCSIQLAGSLVSAIIAVYYASDQYRILGRHLNCEDVKTWIGGDRLAGYGIDQYGEFMPSPAAVLTVSAPNMLLSASLNSFLLGLGTYLAYVWTRHLDTTAGTNDSLAIFITYVASLTACYGLFGPVLVRRSYTTERLVNQPTSARARGSTDGAGMSREHSVKDELIQELHIAA